MKTEIAAAHILVKGRVQGVGYRFFTQEAAEAYALKGWVRNVSGGNVEVEIEGPKTAIEEFLNELRKGPPVARVDALEVNWLPKAHPYTDFEIRG